MDMSAIYSGLIRPLFGGRGAKLTKVIFPSNEEGFLENNILF